MKLELREDEGSIVECVHNRLDRSISFLVDGVTQGSISDVNRDSLHVMSYTTHNAQVKLIPS